MPKRRFAILTWNNPPADAVSQLTEHALDEKPYFSYVIGQLECGSEEKTVHVQAMVYNRAGLCFKDICSHFEGCVLKAHNEDGATMKKYVTKEDTRIPDSQFESGISPDDAMNGGGAQLVKLVNDVKAGEKDPRKLFERYGATYLRTYKGIQHVIELVQNPGPSIPSDPDVDTPPTIETYWLYGEAGAGKSRMAKKMCFHKQWTTYEKNASMKCWYENYQGEECLLYDDMRGSEMSFHEFLQLTDPHRKREFPLQRKGGTTVLRVTKIIVTTDRHPIDMWKNSRAKDNDWAQLKRRLTMIWKCKGMSALINLLGYPEYDDVTDEEPPAAPVMEYVPGYIS